MLQEGAAYGMLAGMRPQILVVDDEPGVRKALDRGLRAEGMDVTVAADGPSALRLARSGSFDAILLDIMIPGLSGYRVLEQLRADGIATPVLLVSAKDGEVDQADGLDLGADGYVVKPFSFVVLLAQLRATLRRAAASTARDLIRLGPLTMDRQARTARYDDADVPLSPREYALLEALAVRAGTVRTKEELLHEVWGDEWAATRNVVEVYIGYLRRKLSAAGGGDLVRTVRGRGYQLGEPR
jgi:DNA-binding response OmpR family regulator